MSRKLNKNTIKMMNELKNFISIVCKDIQNYYYDNDNYEGIPIIFYIYITRKHYKIPDIQYLLRAECYDQTVNYYYLELLLSGYSSIIFIYDKKEKQFSSVLSSDKHYIKAMKAIYKLITDKDMKFNLEFENPNNNDDL